MFVEDLKQDFYNFIATEHVVVMVHCDTDAICAYKIIQTLFRNDNVSYSLVQINGLKDLQTAYRDHCELFRHFLLLNCGGCIDLIDRLDPVDDRSVFFVLDVHRPLDVCNVYNSGQVRIICMAEDVLEIPKFNDIFSEEDIDQDDGNDDNDDDGPGNERNGDLAEGTNDSDNDDDDDEDEDDDQPKRRRNKKPTDNDPDSDSSRDSDSSEPPNRFRISESNLMKKREKRLWREKRDKILMEYTQYSFYAKASSIFLFELAWKMSRDNKELLWFALVAFTEQYLLRKCNQTQYHNEIVSMQGHVTRLTNRIQNHSVNANHVSYENDLNLALFRHWTVESSLKFSPLTACKMRLWSQKGEMRLKDLLVEIGIPLIQSRQNFQSMELLLRQAFQKSLTEVSNRYKFDKIEYPSFFLKNGHKCKFSASDYVYAFLALLESAPASSHDSSFQQCIDALQNFNLLTDGIEKAKVLFISIFQQVQVAISMRLVKLAGPFIYYIVSEDLHEWHLFSQPHSLFFLAQFLLQAYCSVSKNRKIATFPLIICSPISKEDCLLLGIPPLLENSSKNFLGRAFEQVAEKTSCEINSDFFDPTFIKLKLNDRSKFLDALTSLLLQ